MMDICFWRLGIVANSGWLLTVYFSVVEYYLDSSASDDSGSGSGSNTMLVVVE